MQKTKELAAGGHHAAKDIQELRLKDITISEREQLSLFVGCASSGPLLTNLWDGILKYKNIGGVYE